MQVISLENKKHQIVSVTLGGQNCVITLSQNDENMFLSLSIDEKSIVKNVLCLNDVKLIRYKYLGFIGDLFFDDNQGNDNPNYTGLSDRFLLYYDGDA